MKPLCILDLEGTLGIFSNGEISHVNNTARFRPGFLESLSKGNGYFDRAIATRAPKKFVDEIVTNLGKRKISLRMPILAREQVQFKDRKFFSFKDYSAIYVGFDIDEPSKRCVVVGDLLRFPGRQIYRIGDYLSFDFENNPQALVTGTSLNDHPFPDRDGNSPVYVVVPQPWTTFDELGNQTTLDFGYIENQLKKVYALGNGNFQVGFDKMKKFDHINEYVESEGLSANLNGQTYKQRYLVMKGNRENWKELEVVF